MPPIDVAVGIIKNNDGLLLITQRRSNTHLAGLWEFPGGKREAGETWQQALNRELDEEIGITVTASKHLLDTTHQYDEKHVQLSFWRVTAYTGEAYGREGQLHRWVNIADLSQYEFPVANQAILPFLSA